MLQSQRIMIFSAEMGPPAAPSGTLAHLLKLFVRRNPLQPGSIEQKRVSVGCFESYLGRCALLSDFHRDTVDGFVEWYGERAEPATVDAKRKDLLRLWRFAAEEDGISPPFKIRTVRVPEKEPEGWDETELRMILAACPKLKGSLSNGIPKSLFCRAVLLTFLSTGLRSTAQFAVPIKDVRHDLSFTVRWQTQKTWVEQTKRLSRDAWEAIQACHRFGSFSKLLPFDTKLRPIRELFKELLDLAGLDSSRGHGFQQLRRTAASFKERQQPGSARHFLGHKTVGLAERKYLVPRIVRPEAIEPPTLRL